MPDPPVRSRWPASGDRPGQPALEDALPAPGGGPGSEAAAAGASRVRDKMAQAVQLAALYGTQVLDQALGQAAEVRPVWSLRR
jgi:hypothetical protein